MCDEVLEVVKLDVELCDMSRNRLAENDYFDDDFHILTEDIVYFGSMIEKSKDEETVYEYDDPIDITQEQWREMLNNPNIIKPNELNVLRKWLHFQGSATCTEVGKLYKGHPTSYISPMVSMAKRVQKYTNCEFILRNDGEGKPAWWNIPFIGRYVKNDIDVPADRSAAESALHANTPVFSNKRTKQFQWTIRPELHNALNAAGITALELSPLFSAGINFWWLNANPRIWSFFEIKIGEEIAYSLLNDNGNKRRIYQNFMDAKVGDLVVGYESTPVKQIVALCKISRENDGESLYFEKTEGLASPVEYGVIKDIADLQQMEYLVNPQGSLFKLTKDEYELLLDIIREQNPVYTKPDYTDKYTKDDFLNEVYISEDDYDSLTSLLIHKKNVILQGAPGVGKTYTAERLVYSMLGKKDEDKIKMIQFHQSYSYEDFIMGYKPDVTGFKLQSGIFYQFCQQAENHPDEDFFLIIDEINRGNLSKIFGELLMLIEKEYRGVKMTMAYNGLTFSVPENLLIIGMMNTADRSLAMIDYALRRRFSFFGMRPAFYDDAFIKYQRSLDSEALDELIEVVKRLNQDIANDASLGEGFCVGHSYFCGRNNENCTDEWLSEVIEYDLIPMISEYWFDDRAKVQTWTGRLRGVLND